MGSEMCIRDSVIPRVKDQWPPKMGCEFEFGYTAGLLLGRAELAGGGGNSRRGGSGRGGNSRRGGGVVAAWWRCGVLDEFWRNS